MKMSATIRERMEAYIHAPGTAMPMCANCTHYYAHYRKDGWSFGCGHCVYPRMNSRRAYDFCEHFENKNAPSGAANT